MSAASEKSLYFSSRGAREFKLRLDSGMTGTIHSLYRERRIVVLLGIRTKIIQDG